MSASRTFSPSGITPHFAHTWFGAGPAAPSAPQPQPEGPFCQPSPSPSTFSRLGLRCLTFLTFSLLKKHQIRILCRFAEAQQPVARGGKMPSKPPSTDKMAPRAAGCGTISSGGHEHGTSGSAPRERDREGRQRGKDEALWREGVKGPPELVVEKGRRDRSHPDRCTVTRDRPCACSP